MAGLGVVAVNRMPTAEVEMSADLVRRQLADQHPLSSTEFLQIADITVSMMSY